PAAAHYGFDSPLPKTPCPAFTPVRTASPGAGASLWLWPVSAALMPFRTTSRATTSQWLLVGGGSRPVPAFTRVLTCMMTLLTWMPGHPAAATVRPSNGLTRLTESRGHLPDTRSGGLSARGNENTRRVGVDYAGHR